MPTSCPFVAQVNEWQDNWVTFFTRHRLQAQLDLIEKDYADREARELWSQLQVGTVGGASPPLCWGPLVEMSASRDP